MDAEKRIAEIEEEIRNTKRHKGTEHHIGRLLAKIARLRRELILQASKKSGGGGGFTIKKEGNATVVLVGFPSVGKSTLLSLITNAESKVAAYDFTTVSCITGMMDYNGIKIQILDLPGIIKGAGEGKGRGKEVIAAARSADLILILLDATKSGQLQIIRDELSKVGIRLNSKAPDLVLKKDVRGGVTVISARRLTRISRKEIFAILNEYGIHNGTLTIRQNIDANQLIDFLEKNRMYIPALLVVNKIDLVNNFDIKEDYLPISAVNKINIEELKKLIFKKLNFIKVYTKPRKEVKMDEPMVLKRDSTIKIFCKKLPRGFLKNFRYALVWGKSVKFPGQRVGLNHILEEGDIITIVKR